MRCGAVLHREELKSSSCWSFVRGRAMAAAAIFVISFCAWGSLMLPLSCDSDWKPAEGFGKSVVIVGNGPSVTGQPLGQWIDDFDEVVRFNNFKLLAGFTGNKTSVVFYNAMVQKQELWWWNDPRYSQNPVNISTLTQLESGIFWGSECHAQHVSRVCSQCQENKHFGWGYWTRRLYTGLSLFRADTKCVDSSVVEKANALLQAADPTPCQDLRLQQCLFSFFDVFSGPTSGFLSIVYFLSNAAGGLDRVYIHGFDFYQPTPPNDRGISGTEHYYGKNGWFHDIGKMFHNNFREKAAVERLIEQGRVVRLADHARSLIQTRQKIHHARKYIQGSVQ